MTHRTSFQRADAVCHSFSLRAGPFYASMSAEACAGEEMAAARSTERHSAVDRPHVSMSLTHLLYLSPCYQIDRRLALAASD